MAHRWRLLAVAALAAVALAGCASGDPAPEGPTTGPTASARTTSPRSATPTATTADVPTPDGSDAAAATATASPTGTATAQPSGAASSAAASQGSSGQQGAAVQGGAAPPSGNGSGSGSSGGSGGGSGSRSGATTATAAGNERPTGFDKVVGDGTAASCTSQALADAVRSGGSVGFWCGPDPVTITVASTLYTCNTTTCANGGTPVAGMTLDGGGKVTLSGGGARGIFYAAACSDTDKLGWVSGRCDFGSNTAPHVTFRNITLADGNSQGYPAGFTGHDVDVPAGGGAILMIGGSLSLEGVTFRNNVCMTADSDAGGGAVRVFGMPQPVTVSGSRFEGNHCANGGAISSLQAPLTITGSTFTGNYATGHDNNAGAGGNGGAIYFDGTHQDVVVRSTTMTGNRTGTNAGGSAVFYVSNDGTGSLTIADSTFTGNTGQAFFTAPYTSLFFLGRALTVTGGTVQ